MTKKDKVLVDGLKNLAQAMADLAAALEGSDAKAKASQASPAPVQEPVPEPAPASEDTVKSVTMEELRAFLAEKSRSGYRAEVKAMLAKYGVEKLSEVNDPDTWAVMMEEAREIGHG